MSARARVPASAGAVALAVLLYAVAATLPALLMRVLYAEAFTTDGPSMEPTLLHGDRFFVDRTAVGFFLPFEAQSRAHWASPEVGAVVVLRSPMDEVDIVKRVIGVAGDRIAIQHGEVFRNGESLGDEVLDDDACPTEIDSPASCIREHVDGRAWRVLDDRDVAEGMTLREVREGHVFVLGDHRDRSNDSRNPRVGMIPLSRVIGVVRARYYSEAGMPLGAIE